MLGMDAFPSKIELALHVGPLSPPLVKHVRERHVGGKGQLSELERAILVNFVNFKKEKASLKPSPKEVVVSLYNTLSLVSEHVLALHGERYDEDVPDRFVNQVERAWVLNVKQPVNEAMHRDLGWLHATRDECIGTGTNPSRADLLLFENKAKHYLRAFLPERLPR